jgi:hypothetical protein
VSSDHIPDATKMISDTPRTDEQINGKPCTRFEILAGDCLRNAAVPSEFARTLERELNEANAIIKQQQLLDEENLRLKERIKMLEVVERLATAQMDYIQQLETENDAMRADLLLWREDKWRE